FSGTNTVSKWLGGARACSMPMLARVKAWTFACPCRRSTARGPIGYSSTCSTSNAACFSRPDRNRWSRSSPPVSKKLRLLVSLALFGWLAWRTDWSQLARAFAQLRLVLWLGAVALYCLTQVISAVRWQWLAHSLGFSRPLHYYISYYFIGMYFNLMLPT